jgi:branched-chain amino acid transport system ATP-binding protein
MSAAAPLLQLTGLQKAYGALVVTDTLSLDVRAGELHALIGPNGAGKTTLIHQISGTLAPDGGSIRFDNVDVTALPMHRRARMGLARSFQITSILPGFSVLENVAVAVQARDGSSFRLAGIAAREKALNDAAHEVLAIARLHHRAETIADTLSHGEKRQLELAIALALKPKLLLLDEPMAGTGSEESAGLIETLASLKRHYSILLVEHDMHAVFALADRISVLVNGRIIASGDPASIRQNAEVRTAYLGEEAA